mmetsp:Transcript_13713/g.54923  ORF Transcript_13713/g.54923 Transcript_13713/m.54923 type:complete len:92 (-) Transcript_13713:712-987(-)
MRGVPPTQGRCVGTAADETSGRRDITAARCAPRRTEEGHHQLEKRRAVNNEGGHAKDPERTKGRHQQRDEAETTGLSVELTRGACGPRRGG